jgi:hypothetical protein
MGEAGSIGILRCAQNDGRNMQQQVQKQVLAFGEG